LDGVIGALTNPPLKKLHHQNRLPLIRQTQGLHHHIGEEIAVERRKYLHHPFNGL
jgi:hypothetical protein